VSIEHGDSITNVTHDVPHLLPDESRSLQRIVERLIEAYNPQWIYLFGSRARNEGGPDSDFDLLIVVPDTAAEEQTGSRLAYEMLRGTGTAADITVWTRSGFESRLPVAASLPATVVREGLLLYAA
jgi:predicted nucleotidyltransferase